MQLHAIPLLVVRYYTLRAHWLMASKLTLESRLLNETKSVFQKTRGCPSLKRRESSKLEGDKP
jgi:hypothetical protein